MAADEEPTEDLKQEDAPNAIGADGVPFKSLFGPPQLNGKSGFPNPRDTLRKDTVQQTPSFLDSITASSINIENARFTTPPSCDQVLDSAPVGQSLQQKDNIEAFPLPENIALKMNPTGEIKVPFQHQEALDNHRQENLVSHSSESNVPHKRLFQEDSIKSQQRETNKHPEEEELSQSPKAENMPETRDRPAKRRKGSKSQIKYPCGKDARAQAVTRQRKKHDALKFHIRKIMRKQGNAIDIEDVPAPRPKRRRKIKAQASDDSDDSESSIDPDAPEPEAQFVSAKDRAKQISEAVVGGGLTNRRTGSQQADLTEAKLTFGRDKVQALDQGGEMRYQLQGMTVMLRPFQLVGSSWMVKRETDSDHHKGGLLADVPGFGKTVMSLSAIIGNPPSHEEVAEGIKATLVVVPNVEILKQWEREIEKHLEFANRKYFHYQISKCQLDATELGNKGIVLTTYSELQRAWPSAKRRKELLQDCTSTTTSEDGEQTTTIDEEAFEQLCEKDAETIFYVPWYRVIFDEVHSVKNINGQTCLAARKLQYKIFWGLSGTPLVNADVEIFPYLQLIGWTDAASLTQYREKYLKSANGRDRVDALVSLLSYRRTHHDRFLGKKMVSLPKTHSGTQWVTLTDEERVVYDLTTEIFDSAEDRRGATKQLRQRQAISHFYLLEAFFRREISIEAISKYIEELTAVENKKEAFIQIGSWAERQFPGPNPPKCDQETKSSNTTSFGRSDFGGKIHLTPLLEALVNTRVLHGSECTLCRRGKGLIQDPVQLEECKHIFCEKCLHRYWMQQMRNSQTILCPECLVEYHGDIFSVPPVNTILRPPAQAQPVSNDSASKRKGRKKNENSFGEAPNRRPGDDYFGVQPAFAEEDGGLWGKAVLDDMFRNGGIPTPSAKTTAVKDIVLRWLREDPNHKGIIFTQFVTTALVIGRMLQLEGINFLYLNGKVTSTEKLKAIKAFEDLPQVPYLVASMRCGGQSLNLTFASRVIMCDTWWNTAAEEQAFGRVFRYGQLKKTYNVRILARDTIDEDIEQMQDDKDTKIKYTMHDDGHQTQIHSDFEITKILEPERWLEWVQQCVDEIREEDGIALESMDVDARSDQELEAETNSPETEPSMATVFKDEKQKKVGRGKTVVFDLEDGSDGEWLPKNETPANPYGIQDIGRGF